MIKNNSGHVEKDYSSERIKKNSTEVFYCDLDNTLIYSYRHNIGSCKIGVEHYEGEEISFMTQLSASMLSQLRNKMLFVPTTTRTPEQYKRVRLGETLPEYALVCNGGILLRQGISDDEWYQQSLNLVSPSSAELVYAQSLLTEDVDRSFDVRLLHGLFLFTKSNNPSETKRRLRMRLDSDKINVFSHGAKIYVLPAYLTKAHAVSRLNQMLGDVFSFAAGDSPMDAEMLLAASKAFAPQSLAKAMPQCKSLVAIPDENIFSDEFLKMILEAHT